ncbi:hypothetical protein WISP_81132 [Willisornis vidua]|uniref:Phorbol-ester/DAG-type domain-containing protein n=1 Tax=Willisornis vidua TaxID=1566151 RepID=A0ABQ9DAG6_9PASS|nr:hypothetical protein WISP_81132 [Willisornis vidua]
MGTWTIWIEESFVSIDVMLSRDMFPQDTYHHHWREGNLSSSARCEVCKKTCGSSEVLSGMRCEWCGILAHAACYVIVTPECTFGRLRNMILPPSCVQLFSRNFSKLHCFRISENLQTESDEDDDVDGSTQGLAKDVQISTDSIDLSLVKPNQVVIHMTDAWRNSKDQEEKGEEVANADLCFEIALNLRECMLLMKRSS